VVMLLTLAATSSVLAASLCAAPTGMGAVTSGPAPGAGDDCMPGQSGDGHDRHSPKAPQCPFGTINSTGSCVDLSLPSTTVQVATSSEISTAFVSPVNAAENVRASSFFHPPRA